ncbi:MAG: hypothetical protein ACRDMX_14960, partial [Solirubrobacteraceae bacterium]
MGLLLTAASLAAAQAIIGTAPAHRANRAAAQRGAATLLKRAVLPPAATPVSADPTGARALLSKPALSYADMKVAGAHGWWTVPESERAVFAFLRRHLPARAKLLGWGGNGDQDEDFVQDVFPPGVGRLPLRQLIVGLEPLAGNETGVRVDAEVQVIVPRAPGEVIPAGARVLDVTLARPGRRPTVARTVTNLTRVRRVAAMIDRLPVVQPGAYSCPAELPAAPVVTLTFRRTTGGPALASAAQLAAATEPTTPCDPMSLTIRRRHRTPLLGGAGVVHAVQAML